MAPVTSQIPSVLRSPSLKCTELVVVLDDDYGLTEFALILDAATSWLIDRCLQSLSGPVTWTATTAINHSGLLIMCRTHWDVTHWLVDYCFAAWRVWDYSCRHLGFSESELTILDLTETPHDPPWRISCFIVNELQVECNAALRKT